MSTASNPLIHPATFSIDHYEHMVECGAFEGQFQRRDIELFRGKLIEKHTGNPATFSLDHYEHMVEVGAFDPPYDLPVELLHGEIIMMSPIGEPHSLALVALTEWSYEFVDLKKLMIRVQMPLRIPSEQAEPEPDLVWVNRDAAGEKPPKSSDVVLLVEVASSSLAFDRGPKLSTYAEAGIPEYWIVNLKEKQIEVYRDPQNGTYQQKSTHHGEQPIQPLALPQATLTPSRIFS